MMTTSYIAERATAEKALTSRTAVHLLFGMVATLLVAGAMRASSASAEEKKSPLCPECNVVLISIDTLRADSLSLYGNRRIATPEIDAFAKSSLIYRNAAAPSCLTAESHMSMMTGLFPSVHGVTNFDGTGMENAPALHPDTPTLASRFLAAGYRTGAFVSNGNLSPELGFVGGFETYRRGADFVKQKEGTRSVRSWLEQNKGEKFFLFLHSNHVHQPYFPEKLPPHPAELHALMSKIREEFERPRADSFETSRTILRSFNPLTPERVEYLKKLYELEVVEMSAGVGALIQELATISRPTIVLLTADHGEEFQEHGGFGHTKLFRELVHVPLLLKIPSVESAEISAPVSTVQVAPTLLSLTGLSPEPGFQLDPLPLNDAGEPREILSETPNKGIATLTKGQFKIYAKIKFRQPDCTPYRRNWRARQLWNSELPDSPSASCVSVSLYDLKRDPAEQNGISDPARLASMYRTLVTRVRDNAALRASSVPNVETGVETSPKLLKELKTLGYIQ